MDGLQQPLAIMGVATGTGWHRLWRKLMRRTVCRLLGHRWEAHPKLAKITGYCPGEIELSGSLDHLYARIGHTRFHLNGAYTKNHYLCYTCCPICGDRCRLLRPPRLPERDLSTIAETPDLQGMAHGVSHVVSGWRQGYEEL
jgi:hypothetical protein